MISSIKLIDTTTHDQISSQNKKMKIWMSYLAILLFALCCRSQVIIDTVSDAVAALNSPLRYFSLETNAPLKSMQCSIVSHPWDLSTCSYYESTEYVVAEVFPGNMNIGPGFSYDENLLGPQLPLYTLPGASPSAAFISLVPPIGANISHIQSPLQISDSASISWAPGVNPVISGGKTIFYVSVKVTVSGTSGVYAVVQFDLPTASVIQTATNISALIYLQDAHGGPPQPLLAEYDLQGTTQYDFYLPQFVPSGNYNTSAVFTRRLTYFNGSQDTWKVINGGAQWSTASSVSVIDITDFTLDCGTASIAFSPQMASNGAFSGTTNLIVPLLLSGSSLDLSCRLLDYVGNIVDSYTLLITPSSCSDGNPCTFDYSTLNAQFYNNGPAHNIIVTCKPPYPVQTHSPCNTTSVTFGYCSTTGVCLKCLSDADCSGSTPACNTANGMCVGCVSNSYCSGSTPVCNIATLTCVGCLANGDCSGSTPVCNIATHTCAPCVASTDCTARSGCTAACTSNACIYTCGQNCVHNRIDWFNHIAYAISHALLPISVGNGALQVTTSSQLKNVLSDTSPNPIVQLADILVVSVLNTKNGAIPNSMAQSAITNANSIVADCYATANTAWTQLLIGRRKCGGMNALQFSDVALKLFMFNIGFLGTPHCTTWPQ